MVDAKVYIRKPEPVAGKKYVITAVQTIQTRLGNAIRIELTGEDNNEYETVLWIKEQVGPKSKLGAFITALGNDENEWKGKTIYIESWDNKNRVIRLVSEDAKKKK